MQSTWQQDTVQKQPMDTRKWAAEELKGRKTSRIKTTQTAGQGKIMSSWEKAAVKGKADRREGLLRVLVFIWPLDSFSQWGPLLFSTLDPLWQKQAIQFQTWSLWNVDNPLHADNKDIAR